MNREQKLEALTALHELESQLRKEMLDCVTAERDSLRFKVADADKRADFWQRKYEIEVNECKKSLETRDRKIDDLKRQLKATRVHFGLAEISPFEKA